MASDLSDLSLVIGELRSSASAQSSTNLHMLEELKKITDRMAGFGEVGATFIEYRKTLHERFDKIHEQIGVIDLIAEKLQDRVTALEQSEAEWKANWKVLAAGVYLAASVTGVIISTFGSSFIHALR